MRVAVITHYAAIRTEPLGEVLARVIAAFASNGFDQAELRFRLSDAPELPPLAHRVATPQHVSSVARVLKRYPDFAPFVQTGPPQAGATSGARRLCNVAPDGTAQPVDPASLQAIAAGVPRSFPFHQVWLHVTAPGFAEAAPDLPEGEAGVDATALPGLAGTGARALPGVVIQDSWWVNGRQRSMTAVRLVEADPGAKKLPEPPAISALLAACGKARKRMQVPIGTVGVPRPQAVQALQSTPEGQRVLEIVRSWRARLPEMAETLPHDPAVPFTAPPRMTTGAPYGPRKPDLERVFGPMGYSIRGETGSFTLTRRTANNLTVALTLDVGTWSDHITASLSVVGVMNGGTFAAAMSLPPCRQAPHGTVRGVGMYGQITVGTAERWAQFVDNLGVLMQRLTEGFVPEVEAVTGPSPAWFKPRA